MCAGNGTRLKPITNSISKHLLQVYDKPMVYYPMSVLMLAGIKDILFIVNRNHLDQYKKLFGNGSDLGINLEYKIQEESKGIAEGLILAEEFLNNSPSLVILGDNLLYGNLLEKTLLNISNKINGATIFLQKVRDPQRFCIAKFNDNNQLINLVEKPSNSDDDLAVIGLYFFDKFAPKYAKKIKKSSRGEFEITDLNKIYLEKGQLDFDILGRGFTWLDMGTFESLNESQSFVSILQNKQGYKIACLEEISLYKNWISEKDLNKKIDTYNNEYGKYLRSIISKK
tara:strand:+ start:498 stop:1349 length:852 start_codon:yes stop_codon:yes gene_type:complete